MLLDSLSNELVLSSLIPGSWPGQKVCKVTAVLVLKHGFPWDIAKGWWHGKIIELECLETWFLALAGGTFDFGSKCHYHL